MTLDSRGVMTAAASLEGATIVPVHAEGWAHFSEPIDHLRASIEAAGLAGRFRFLTPGVPSMIA
jgi:hypothetical protein